MIDIYRLCVGLDGALVVADTLKGVSLSQVAEAVVRGRDLQNQAEVGERFVPLLLENVDLTTRDVGFNVFRVLDDSLGQSSECTRVVINPSICNREHYIHSLSVLGASIYELVEVSDGLVRLVVVQVGHAPVEEGVQVELVQ